MYRYITLFVLLLVGCQEQSIRQSSSVHICILEDKSEDFEIQPLSNWLKQMVEIEHLDSIRISYEVLNDLPFHGTTEIQFNRTTGLLSNEVENRQKEKAFFEKIETELFSSDSLKKNAPKSYLYPILVKHLNEGQADEIHLFSDLKENNSFINLYHFNSLEFQRNYKAIKSAFEAVELKDGNTKVYLYYKVQNYQDGIYYGLLIKLYEALLIPKGYEVHIGNINPLMP